MTWSRMPSFTDTCNFVVRTNTIFRYRAGEVPHYGYDSFDPVNLFDYDAVLASPATEEVQELVIYISGHPGEVDVYAPGDHLSYSFFRNPTGEDLDTCEGASANFNILGMSAHPG